MSADIGHSCNTDSDNAGCRPACVDIVRSFCSRNMPGDDFASVADDNDYSASTDSSDKYGSDRMFGTAFEH